MYFCNHVSYFVTNPRGEILYEILFFGLIWVLFYLCWRAVVFNSLETRVSVFKNLAIDAR